MILTLVPYSSRRAFMRVIVYALCAFPISLTAQDSLTYHNAIKFCEDDFDAQAYQRSMACAEVDLSLKGILNVPLKLKSVYEKTKDKACKLDQDINEQKKIYQEFSLEKVFLPEENQSQESDLDLNLICSCSNIADNNRYCTHKKSFEKSQERIKTAYQISLINKIKDNLFALNTEAFREHIDGQKSGESPLLCQKEVTQQFKTAPCDGVSAKVNDIIDSMHFDFNIEEINGRTLNSPQSMINLNMLDDADISGIGFISEYAQRHHQRLNNGEQGLEISKETIEAIGQLSDKPLNQAYLAQLTDTVPLKDTIDKLSPIYRERERVVFEEVFKIMAEVRSEVGFELDSKLTPQQKAQVINNLWEKMGVKALREALNQDQLCTENGCVTNSYRPELYTGDALTLAGLAHLNDNPEKPMKSDSAIQFIRNFAKTHPFLAKELMPPNIAQMSDEQQTQVIGDQLDFFLSLADPQNKKLLEKSDDSQKGIQALFEHFAAKKLNDQCDRIKTKVIRLCEVSHEDYNAFNDLFIENPVELLSMKEEIKKLQLKPINANAKRMIAGSDLLNSFKNASRSLYCQSRPDAFSEIDLATAQSQVFGPDSISDGLNPILGISSNSTSLASTNGNNTASSIAGGGGTPNGGISLLDFIFSNGEQFSAGGINFAEAWANPNIFKEKGLFQSDDFAGNEVIESNTASTVVDNPFANDEIGPQPITANNQYKDLNFGQIKSKIDANGDRASQIYSSIDQIIENNIDQEMQDVRSALSKSGQQATEQEIFNRAVTNMKSGPQGKELKKMQEELAAIRSENAELREQLAQITSAQENATTDDQVAQIENSFSPRSGGGSNPANALPRTTSSGGQAASADGFPVIVDGVDFGSGALYQQAIDGGTYLKPQDIRNEGLFLIASTIDDAVETDYKTYMKNPQSVLNQLSEDGQDMFVLAMDNGSYGVFRGMYKDGELIGARQVYQIEGEYHAAKRLAPTVKSMLAKKIEKPKTEIVKAELAKEDLARAPASIEITPEEETFRIDQFRAALAGRSEEVIGKNVSKPFRLKQFLQALSSE